MADPTPRAAIERIIAAAPDGVEWGLHIRGGPADGVDIDADRVLMAASIGKVMLLAAVSHALDAGELEPDELLAPTADDRVGDSGLWQHLHADRLSVVDAAVLVAAVSDNLATNVLLRRLGLDAVQAASERMGMSCTLMLDRIRDVRVDGDPPGPSQASARELSGLLARIARADQGSSDSRVRSWLSLTTDLSMVAAAICLDPLAHSEEFIGKTGSDLTVRADTGSLTSAGDSIAYAVIANWTRPAAATADAVVRAMRAIGEVALAGDEQD